MAEYVLGNQGWYYTHEQLVGVGHGVLEGAEHGRQHDRVDQVRTVGQPAQGNPETGRQQTVDQTWRDDWARREYALLPCGHIEFESAITA